MTAESVYEQLFVKTALRSLLDDYFEGANRFTTKIDMLNLDSLADFILTVDAPLNKNSEEGIVGNAEFCLKSVGWNGETILDICVSNTEPALKILMGWFAKYPELDVGAFLTFTPFFTKQISSPGGITYRSGNVFAGATLSPPNTKYGRFTPQTAWLVSKMGMINAGVQYETKFISKDSEPFATLENWSFAINYERNIDSSLTPSFNFGLQFANNSQFIASYYQRMVFQRQVRKYPFETNKLVWVTNYFDFGFEFQKRMGKYPRESTFQAVGSWHSKNILVKGKVGTQSSSIALVFKSLWSGALTFNILAVRDRTKRETSFGFGFQIDNNWQTRHQAAHPGYVMDTEHSAVNL